MNLYLKFNDFGCDPLGEDPYTAAVGERSRRTLATAGGNVGSLVPRPGRRLDTLARTYTRAEWEEVLQARIFGQVPFGVTKVQFAAVQAADGHRTIDQIAADIAPNGDAIAVRTDIVELVGLGALEVG